MSNVKTITITVPSQQVLNKLNSTPTFARLSRQRLVVGQNTERVNHAQYEAMMRLYPLIGVQVSELK